MLSLRIALRYLLSRKSNGAVNVISAVSMAGVAVTAAAMIVVLSVFNGFTQLVEKKTSSFNPPLLVVPAEGKTISDADSLAAALQMLPEVSVASPVIDEQAFAVASTGQMPVHIRALAPAAMEASGLHRILVDGALDTAGATISVGVAMQLNLRPAGTAFPEGATCTSDFEIFEPVRTGRVNPANPSAAFSGDSLRVTGVYQVEQEDQDRDMLVMPLSQARKLLMYTTEATGIAIYLTHGGATPSADALAEARNAVETRLPAGNLLLDRLQQESEAYRMIAVEKWITFLMLLFIMAVASFNIVSTLSLLVVEKRQNMGVMTAMGAPPRLISGIFANQGWLITIAGGLAGILLGSLLTLGQQHFGWVRLASDNPALMAVDTYPVALTLPDVLVSLVSVAVISVVMAAVAALLALPRQK